MNTSKHRTSCFFMMLLLSALLFAGCGARLNHSLQGIKYPGANIYADTKDIGKLVEYYYPQFIVLMPGAFITDTLMLPYDLAKYAHYCATKPLNELILENDLETLEQRLKNGADPDFIDPRFNDKYKRFPLPPIAEAFKQHNIKAFTLLLEHGASVPIDLFCNFHNSALRLEHRYNVDDLEYYKRIFDKGFPTEKAQCFAAQTVVSEWIEENLSGNSKLPPEKVLQLFELTKLFLENGFPPNPQTVDPSPASSRINALDSVYNSKLNDTDKRMFTELLKTYHAKTTAELESLNTVPLPPETALDSIPDIFKPVVDILTHSNLCSQYRYSATYPGVDSPVLVADFGGREKTAIHHRETPTRWNQEGEPFDIPEYHRIVLTPKGVKVPSRIQDDIPKYDVIWEEWYSLPTCEAYIERHIGPVSNDEKQSLDRIRRLAGIEVSPNDFYYPFSQKKDPYFIHIKGHYPLQAFFKKDKTLFGDNVYSGRFSELIGGANAANKLLKQAGIRGKWFKHAYSSHRDLLHLAAEKDHIVPFPDEILILMDVDHFSKNDNHFYDYSMEQKGKYYWNCHAYTLKRKMGHCNIYVFFGDEADKEKINVIIRIAQEAFGK